MLRQLKTLKQEYREKFALLKSAKQELSESATSIDILKERLISQFEEWYPKEFDIPTNMNAGMINELEQEAKDSSTDWL